MRALGTIMASSCLTAKEVKICRELFDAFDTDRNGTIDVVEIKSALKSIGQSTTEEDLFLIMSEADANNSGVIEFEEFLTVIEKQKAVSQMSKDENATIDAFVALGGNADRSGKVSLEKLKSTLDEFDLLQNLRLVDRDGSGYIDFEEFKAFVG